MKPVRLRVTNVSTEQRSRRERGQGYLAPLPKVTQVLLAADDEDAYAVLGTQSVTLDLLDHHPLLDGLHVDQVFELRPLPAHPHPPSPGRSDP